MSTPLIGLVTRFDPSDRVTVNLPASVRAGLALYQEFYTKTNGPEHVLDTSTLVAEFLKYMLKNDAGYAKYAKSNEAAFNAKFAELAGRTTAPKAPTA